MTRWAMVADLERCVGCQTCTAACRHANATSPAVQWRKVLDIEAGAFPNVKRTFVPVGCQHCADPPCMHVCPTTATRQRADGIVTIDYDICIGCAYCDVACPYQARFKITKEDFAYGAGAMQNEIEREDPARLGVAQKCTFCSDRIDFGIENGLTPGSDPRATPACVNSCIADALHFGDVEDPDSNVSQAAACAQEFPDACRARHRAGLPLSLRQGGGRAGAGCAARGLGCAGRAHSHAAGSSPGIRNTGTGRPRRISCAAAPAPDCSALPPSPALVERRYWLPGLAALALIACGLTLLMFKIGRPLRFLYVLRQPQRSWMSREAWVAGLLFPLALFALWFGYPLVLLAAALVALLFLFCQGMILEQSKGIPAWRNPRVIAFIMATGLAEGCGLFLLLAAVLPDLGAVARPMALALVVLAATRSWTWRRYFNALVSDGVPTRTLEIFTACRGWFFAGGLVLPVVLVAVGLMLTAAGAALFALAGLSVFATGWAIKFILITRAAYNQGFALPHTPIRGSGVPGPAVKPGWTLP